MGLVLLIFILVPVVEIWLLITVGSEIGALPTIGLIFLTAVIGVAMIRWQGLTTLMRANERLHMGEMPAREMLEGMLLALAGVLLLVPGFATDALGFACLVPPVRHWLAGRWLARSAGAQIHTRVYRPGAQRDHDSAQRDQGSGKPGRTLEGDFTRDDDNSGRKDDQ
jgi:UPF0716 protein FxsA